MDPILSWSFVFNTLLIASSCAQIIELRNPTGEFVTPNYPLNYTANSNVQWRINVPDPRAKIHLHFPDFSTEFFYDWLEVRDGNTTDAPVLLQQSGATRASPLISSGPTLFITFHSDGETNDRGFNAVYVQTLNDIYREQIAADMGTISSPQHPSEYPANFDYSWVMTSPTSAARLQLNFKNFDLNASDEVEVRDGNETSSPLLGRHFGSTLPPVYFSTGQSLLVRLVSKSNRIAIAGKGFHATFESIVLIVLEKYVNIDLYEREYNESRGQDKVWILQSPSTTINFTLQFHDTSYFNNRVDFFEIRLGTNPDSQMEPDGSESHQVLSGYQYQALDKFASEEEVIPNDDRVRFWSAYSDFYLNYTNNAEHTWTLTSPVVENRLLIEFLPPFETEDEIDIVEIRDGNSSSPIIAGLSGSIPNHRMQFVTTTNQGFVGFKTDGKGVAEGFFAIADNLVNGIYSNQYHEGVLASPNYPSVTPHNIDFSWRFWKPGSFWEFTFDEFSTVEPADYLEVRDGSGSSAQLIGNYSGSVIPPNIRSAGTDFNLRLVTNGVNPSKGFKGTAVSKFWSDSLDPEGDYLMSNKFPQQYPPRTEQYWLLKCPTSQVQLVFHNFSIFTASTNDQVKIRDGSNQYAPLLGSHRGRTLPLPYYSPRNELFVSMNGYYSDNGFKASFVCSQRTTQLKNYGDFHSPHFPQEYTNNLTHTWIIVTPNTQSVVRLIFHEFDTERNFDVVEIRDGDTAQSPLLYNLSGSINDVPPFIDANTNKMWVRFTSNAGGTRKGFFASYFDPAGVTPTTRPTTTSTTISTPTTISTTTSVRNTTTTATSPTTTTTSLTTTTRPITTTRSPLTTSTSTETTTPDGTSSGYLNQGLPRLIGLVVIFKALFHYFNR